MILSTFFDESDLDSSHQLGYTRKCSLEALNRFRAGACILMTIVYFWQVLISKSLFILIEYLTLHGVFLAWLYFSLTTIDAIIFKKGSNHPKIVIKKMNYWMTFIYESAACFQVPITIIYWALLFKYDLKRLKTQHVILFALQHSVPIALLLMDFVFNRYRFKLKRLILILLHGVGYLFLNIAYTKLARPVYPIMKWNNIISVIYAIAACILIVVSFLAYRLLNSSWKKIEYTESKFSHKKGHQELKEEREN